MLNKKRGQVTIFIIIGIVVLLTASIILYVNTIKERPEQEAFRPVIEEVPLEARPISSFIDDCVRQTATTALKRVGDYGGYTDIRTLPDFSVNSNQPTESDGVQFSPGSGLVVPYWWYLKSPNDCEGTCSFDSRRPVLYRNQGEPSIETQLDNYIDENLKGCLENFKYFEEQAFTITELGEVNTTSFVAAETVNFFVTYPLKVERGGKDYDVKDHFVEIDLNLREIYELATKITNLQVEHSFLEKQTRQLIDIFSRKDSGSLPPVVEMGFEFGGGETWVKSNVKDDITNIVTTYVPLLQVLGVRNFRFIEPRGVRDPELAKRVYNRGMIIPLNESHSSLEVYFKYLPWWPVYFDLNCNGEICESESITSTFITMMGVQRYNFAYDISYPVMVEINNPFAFRETGYSFKFFLESNLRNNMPFNINAKPLEVPTIQTPDSGTMICDVNKRTSGKVTIDVLDGSTRRPLDDAYVTYQCDGETCTLGKTEEGKFVSEFPRCLGGLLGVRKNEYFTYYENLDTFTSEAQSINAVLEPFRSRDVVVKRYMMRKTQKYGGWIIDFNNLGFLAPKEQAVITLKRISTDKEEEFTTFAEVYGGPLSNEDDLSKDMRIVPGTYEVQISTFLWDNLVIPPDERCFTYASGFLGTGQTEECYFIPEEPIVFSSTSPYPEGSAEFEWEITAEDLDSGNTIEFRVIDTALETVPEQNRVIEDLEQFNSVRENTPAFMEELKPRVVTG